MAREKKPVHKVQMTDGKRDIIIQDALKDLLGATIKEMLETEMEEHLGYGKSERSDTDDYRNGYKAKRINSSMDIQVPQDCKSTLEPQVRNTMKYVADKDRKPFCADLKKSIRRQPKKKHWRRWNESLKKGSKITRIPCGSGNTTGMQLLSFSSFRYIAREVYSPVIQRF